MAAKPFESTMQDLVYNMDVGIGLKLVKNLLYWLMVVGILAIYPASQFHGLKDAEAMDYAQLGRTLMAQKQWNTQCIRPLSLWYLSRTSDGAESLPAAAALVDRHPDLLHAPLYPAVLASLFKITGVSFAMNRNNLVFGPEKLITALNCVLTLITGLLVFLLGRRLFDRRVALLGMTVYFLSDTILSMAISGLAIPLATLFTTAACYTALVGASNRQEGLPPARWAIPLAASALLCSLAFLTRYGTAVMALALAVYIGLSFPARKPAWMGAFLLVFLLGISPWLIRNQIVGGHPLGLAPYTALLDSNLYEGDLLERNMNPAFGGVARVMNALQSKWMRTFPQAYGNSLRTMGDGLLVCIFLTMFLHRFVRPQVHRLRWCLALGLVLLLVIGSFFGEMTLRLLFLFWPLVILYALAFFLVLLERLQLEIRLFQLAATTALVTLSALPLVLTLLPPRTGSPYPPYHPPFVALVSNMLAPTETLCTDMPWATAWYGNRASFLLPASLEEFYRINDYTRRISGLYLTTLTRDKPYARTLLSGPYKTWFPILEGRIPADFPLAHGFALPPNSADQVFLTDRQRWKE